MTGTANERQFLMRLSEDEHAALKTWAAVTGKSMNEHALRALRRYLRQEAAANPTKSRWALDTWAKFSETIARMDADDTTPDDPSP